MIRKTLETHRIGRRDLMAMFGVGVVAAMGVTMISNDAMADTKSVMDAIKKVTNGKDTGSGKITLDFPQIAENGNTVPIAIEVASPMSDADYVKKLHVWAEKNPSPEVASFAFTPASGRAKIATRIRMAKTQNIVAVAEMSDGSFQMAKAEIKVTIGGCGG